MTDASIASRRLDIDQRPLSRPIDALGVAVSLFCCLLWAGNSVAIKFTVPPVPPFACAGLRFTLALPLIWLACRYEGDRLWVPWRYWPLLLLGGVFNFAQIGSFTVGTSWTDAGRATTLINVHPLVVAPLSMVVLGERLPLRALIGAGLAVIGVAVVLSDSVSVSTGLMAGDLVVLASGLFLGIYIVYQKLCLRWIRPLPYLFWNLALSVPCFAAATLLTEQLPEGPIPTHALVGLAYQAFVVSAGGFVLWMWLLRRYAVTVLSVFGLTTPVMGVLLGHVLRDEPLTAGLLVGGALLICGLYLVVRR